MAETMPPEHDRPERIPAGRGHEQLPHTADAGLRAWAPNLPALFEEAARALAETAADLPPQPGLGVPEAIELAAGDPVGLVFAWLNELIGLADSRGAALVRTEVDRVDAHEASGHPAWRMRGHAWFLPTDGELVRRRIDVKSATYHGLAVERAGEGWTLVAYLDV